MNHRIAKRWEQAEPCVSHETEAVSTNIHPLILYRFLSRGWTGSGDGDVSYGR